MSGPSPSKRQVPALFTDIGDIASNHFRAIAIITGSLGGLVAILDGVFGIRLVPYGTAFMEYLTSEGFTTVILLVILISQILLYQRIEWIVGQLEPEDAGEDQDETSGIDSDTETDNALTDGGSSGLPPRDSKGRFTTQDSGGSNILLLVLAALLGYVVSVETGWVAPLAGALIAIALISLFQAMED